MKKIIQWLCVCSTLLWLLSGLEPSHAQNNIPITGRWLGGFEHNGIWSFLDLDLDQAHARTSAFLPPTHLNTVEGYPAILVEGEPIVLQGQVTNNVYRSDDGVDTFILYRAESNRPSMETFEGSYKTDDTLYYIYPLAGLVGSVHADLMARSADGITPLIFISPDTFYSQQGDTFAFERDATGAISNVVVTTREGMVKEASLTHLFTKESITFHNGDITLHGILLLPDNIPNAPAVVLTHGSGEGLAQVYQYEGTRFAQQGIAVLAYDKREAWQTASLTDLAEDVVAAVEYVQTRREVNSAAVGVWGVSQGGWVAPLAATRSDTIAFVSVLSPSLSPAQQNLYRRDNNFRYSGYPENAIIARRRAYALIQEISVLAREGYVPTWLGQDTFLVDLDVGAMWEQVRQPVLIEMGANDKLVPVDDSIALIQAALQHGGNPDYKVIVYDGADHGAYMGEGYQFAPRDALRFAPGYYIQSPTWILQRFGADAPPVVLTGRNVSSYTTTNATNDFDANGTYGALPWYGSPYVQLGLIVAFTVVFLTGSLLGIVRQRAGRAYGWVGILSGVNLLLVLGVVYFIFQVLDMPENAPISAYGISNYFFILAYLSILITLGIAVFLGGRWRGTLPLAFVSLITVTTLGLWWFLWYWKVL